MYGIIYSEDTIRGTIDAEVITDTATVRQALRVTVRNHLGELFSGMEMRVPRRSRGGRCVENGRKF